MPPFSNRDQQNWLHDEDDDTLIVIWAGEKLRFKLPPPDAPLSELRRMIAERTGVEPQHQKLIMGGAIMQKDLPLKTYGLVSRSQADKSRRDNDDDDDLLPSLGIRDLLSKWGLGNSSLAKGKKRQPLTIRLIGSKETTAVVSDKLPGSANAASGTASSSSSSSRRRPADHGERGRMAPPKNEELDEKRTIAKIDSLVTTTLEKLDGYLKKYLAQPGGDPAAAAAAAATGGEAPKLTKAENYKQHAFLSENLLQLLLKLDGIEIPNSEYTDARKFRKESIRKVQGILEQVDAVKENVGAGSTNPSSAAQSNTVVR